MAWHFAPESAGSNWGSATLSGSKPPATSSGTPSLPRRSWLAWLTARSRVLRSGTTCEPSTLARGVAEWIGSLPVTRANRSASQANEPEPTTLGTCGPMFDVASQSPASASCSSRTCRDTFRLGSPTFLPILPRSGSMRSGACSERTTLELHTDANDSGCWPTPTAMPYGYQQSLTRDGKGPARESLQTRAAKWPTPTAHDGRRPALDTTSTQGANLSRDAATHLAQTMPTAGPGGMVLNPLFVEALMGFPLGWTDFAPLETPSSPPVHPPHSDCSAIAH